MSTTNRPTVTRAAILMAQRKPLLVNEVRCLVDQRCVGAPAP